MDWLNKLLTAPGSDLGPLLIVPRALIVFIVAIAYVRLAKKRFLAQASALDVVMAVIFGSVLSRGINGGASLVSCLVAGLALVTLHRLLIFWAARFPRFYNLVKGSRNLVAKDGVLLLDAMHIHDVTEEDIRQALRTTALTDDLSQVHAATLERSGRISIVKK